MTSELLTTEELSNRIKYDVCTIRERLKDSVLVEGVHYFRPFGGRKILYVWDAATGMGPPGEGATAACGIAGACGLTAFGAGALGDGAWAAAADASCTSSANATTPRTFSAKSRRSRSSISRPVLAMSSVKVGRLRSKSSMRASRGASFKSLGECGGFGTRANRCSSAKVKRKINCASARQRIYATISSLREKRRMTRRRVTTR